MDHIATQNKQVWHINTCIKKSVLAKLDLNRPYQSVAPTWYHNSTMESVIEADFCANGIQAIANLVIDGLMGPKVLFGAVRCVCTNTIHTPECVQHFHHHVVQVPMPVAESAIDFIHREAQPFFGTHLLQLIAGNEQALVCVSKTGWMRSAEFKVAAVHAAASKTLSAQSMLKVVEHLPRELALAEYPRVDTIDDAAAAQVLKEYRSWLNNKEMPVSIHSDHWLPKLRTAATLALTKLPKELQIIVLSFIFC